jgi:hypothetical protein
VGAAVGLPLKDKLGRGDAVVRVVCVYDEEALRCEVPVCAIVCVACTDDEAVMDTEALGEYDALADSLTAAE